MQTNHSLIRPFSIYDPLPTKTPWDGEGGAFIKALPGNRAFSFPDARDLWLHNTTAANVHTHFSLQFKYKSWQSELYLRRQLFRLCSDNFFSKSRLRRRQEVLILCYFNDEVICLFQVLNEISRLSVGWGLLSKILWVNSMFKISLLISRFFWPLWNLYMSNERRTYCQNSCTDDDEFTGVDPFVLTL